MASSRSRTPGQSSGPNRGSGRPQSEGRVLRSRATLAAAVFGLLLIVVGVAAYAGRDKGSDTQVGAGGTVPTKGETAPTLAATPTTTAPPVEAPTTSAAAIETTAPTVAVESTLPGSGFDPSCPAADGTAARKTKFASAPPMCIDPAKSYTAIMRTSKGTMTFTLDGASAPQTVNNFVVLSRFHFYDGLTFHRIIPKFIAQGGDPLGTGEGDPGYRFADELPTTGTYKRGSLVMAKFDEEPNSNGSQFFIAIGDLAAALPLNYSLFGQLTEGTDVLAAIEKAGSADGTPKEDVTIQAVTISEGRVDSSSAPQASESSAAAAPAAAPTTIAADSSVTVR